MTRLVPALALLLVPRATIAEDWPQWRGPSSQGISTETGLPERWSATENIAWKAKLAGFGASSPIITGGLVVVTSQIGSYRSSAGRDPLLARDDPSLSAREHAMSGPAMASSDLRGGVFLAVEAFRAADGKRHGNIASGPRASCRNCTRSTTSPRRRRHPTENASMRGSATGKWSRSTGRAEKSGSARRVKVFTRHGSSIEANRRGACDNERCHVAFRSLGRGRAGRFLCPDDFSRSGNGR